MRPTSKASGHGRATACPFCIVGTQSRGLLLRVPGTRPRNVLNSLRRVLIRGKTGISIQSSSISNSGIHLRSMTALILEIHRKFLVGQLGIVRSTTQNTRSGG